MEDRRTVILTGASRGIGHATARRFSDAGWRVITCSRDDVPAECLIGDTGHRHIVADLGDGKSLDGFIDEANAVLGDDPLHGLVNNAGVSPKTDFKERLGCLNGAIDQWREVFELNFFAPLRLGRGFAAALHRGGGRHRQRDLDRRPPGASLRRQRLRDVEGGALGPDPRDGCRVRPPLGAGQRGGAGRDRDRHAVARDRGDDPRASRCAAWACPPMSPARSITCAPTMRPTSRAPRSWSPAASTCSEGRRAG